MNDSRRYLKTRDFCSSMGLNYLNMNMFLTIKLVSGENIQKERVQQNKHTGKSPHSDEHCGEFIFPFILAGWFILPDQGQKCAIGRHARN